MNLYAIYDDPWLVEEFVPEDELVERLIELELAAPAARDMDLDDLLFQLNEVSGNRVSINVHPPLGDDEDTLLAEWDKLRKLVIDDHEETPGISARLAEIRDKLDALGYCTCGPLGVSFVRIDDAGNRTTFVPGPTGIGYERVAVCPDHPHPAETCPHHHKETGS